ncbi:hypothetical protein AVEN_68448-1 [Araneus ventricosus]|uniref:Uncharacterized protein n=1 Tax=Araneus ventricosus TaxID=182803 RepID=A0A4Y2LCM1_ARAVE|nr:hypothetical protein AVEN_68448-1 [Araneus ventricosus]
MTRKTLEIAPHPNFRTTPMGRHVATTFDLTCNRPNTQRIFNEIRIRASNPPDPKPRLYHETTAAHVVYEEQIKHQRKCSRRLVVANF